jgi:hypothetical protein
MRNIVAWLSSAATFPAAGNPDGASTSTQDHFRVADPLGASEDSDNRSGDKCPNILHLPNADSHRVERGIHLASRDAFVKATETALRVLCAVIDHQQPTAADVHELKLLNPRPDAPPDDIACEAIAQALKRRADKGP